MMRFSVPVLLFLTTLPALAGTPGEITERGRGLHYALDLLLAPSRAEEGRTLWMLVDPTDSLVRASFADEFADALRRNADRLRGTRIGVVRMGTDGGPKDRPTEDLAEATRRLTEAVTAPDRTFKDVYAEVRRLAAAAEKGSEIVLVTLENGDAEADLEAAASLLARKEIRLSVIAREAFLSDTYWVNRGSTAPRGYDMAGGEAAFIEVPWGWVFQHSTVNEAVPSGYAIFGLTRLAGASGGKVFLYYPPSTSPSTCIQYGTCPFCANDHVHCHEPYAAHRLRALAPVGGSRAEALATAAKDPYLAAVLKAWGRASKAKLVRSRPSVRRAGSTLRPERRLTGNDLPVGSGVSLSSQASRAEKLIDAADRIRTDLESDLEKAEAAGGGSDRYRALAELVRLQLLVTRVNLVAFVAFCREAGPTLLSQTDADLAPPERPWRGADSRVTGITYTNMPLCHGVERFADLRLPGGDPVDAEIASLRTPVEGFLARYSKTQFAEAAKRFGLARFQLAFRGRYVPPPERDIRNREDDETATGAKERPNRGGADSGGSGGGSTSGGK